MWAPPALLAAIATRFSLVDVCWTVLSPALALAISGTRDLTPAATYCLAATGVSLVALRVFRIGGRFTVHNSGKALNVALFVPLLTCLILFSLGGMEHVPRPTPFVHALILASGLLGRRAIRSLRFDEHPLHTFEPERERVIVVRCNKLTEFYVSFLQNHTNIHIEALLDDRPEMRGRRIGGATVCGGLSELGIIIDQCRRRGGRIGRVLVATDAESLEPNEREELTTICSQDGVLLEYIPELIGVRPAPRDANREEAFPAKGSRIWRYFGLKFYLDLALSFVLVILLLPLFLVAAVVVMIGFGVPVFHRTRCLGRGGRAFELYEFRTDYSNFASGGVTSERSAPSRLGLFLRKSRLCKLPMLLNVLVGDMSFVGPRPLALEQQPVDPGLRLMVRPGIIGLAQANGAQGADIEFEKELDRTYVRQATVWLDLKILILALDNLIRRKSTRSSHHPF